VLHAVFSFPLPLNGREEVGMRAQSIKGKGEIKNERKEKE
jgi:hypothetical protein